MVIFICSTFGIAIISILVCVILKLKMTKNSKIVENEENSLVFNNNENSFPSIQIVENEKLQPSEKNKIVDNNIKQAISIIENSIPNATIIGKNAKNATKMLNNERVFFSAAKEGTQNMLKVKGSKEVYGIQMAGSKFDKQTKFLNENDLIKACGKDQIINASFGAASMIVGQYYMNEINNKLDKIKCDIQGILDLLDSKYQSNLAQIISKMQEIIQNKIEILNNNYSRDKRYDETLNLENTCTELLGQANEMIKKYINDENIDYKKYEKNIEEIHKWILRQQLLQTLLLEIGNLRYVLAYGNETSKLSHTQYNNYLKQTNVINEKLQNWHKVNCEKLGIDKEEKRRNAKLFEIRKNTIGKIKEEWAYHKIKEEIVNKINSQTNIKKLNPYTKEKQNEKIKIQKYKGEYYNLPNISNS